MRERVSVLGATGSVGRAALDVIAAAGQDRLRVAALCAGRNVEALARAAMETDAEFAAIADDTLYQELKDRLAGSRTRPAAGAMGIREAAQYEAERIVCAISGSDGLAATAAAIGTGALVALANKEALVCAGPILMELAAARAACVIPIDSEHNAIFQVLSRPESVEKLILTASGGPFRAMETADMVSITPQQACAHPIWNMGAKISVDSATMMNKGLELIEAVHLFDIPHTRIDIVLHPQSIIHSLVAYTDGSVLAQMGTPDMRTPISYALAYPERLALPGVERLDLVKLAQLDFEQPDTTKFPSLRLARESLEMGKWGPIILCTANEVAVAAFLRGALAFTGIASMVAHMLQRYADGHFGQMSDPATLEDVQHLICSCRHESEQMLAVSLRDPAQRQPA